MSVRTKFQKGMYINYNNMLGKIDFLCHEYITFNPLNSNTKMLVFRENWFDVTVL